MPEPQDAGLKFSLLGRPQWQRGETSGPLSGKFALLVAYLALQGRQPRDTVARLLWSGDLQHCQDSLRQHEYRLRKATGHDVFDHGDNVALLAGIACDLNEPASAWPLERLLAPAEFLSGWAAKGVSPLLVSWVAEQRRRIRGSVADALCERAAWLEADAHAAQALPLAVRAAELAPWSETAWRACMRLRWHHNDHAAALAAFAKLEEELQRHGAQPSAETLALRDAIRAGTRAARPAVRSVPPVLLRPPQLIGRAAAWAAMERAWAGGRPFLLQGPAGSGKSRLLTDFVQVPQDASQDATVVIEARPGDESWPYAVLAALLRAVMRNLPAVPQAAVAGPLAVLLEPAQAHEPVEQFVLWRAAESLLAAAAAGRLRVLAVDDLQFADLASLEALRWLAAGDLRQRLRFGFATRGLEAGARQSLIEDWLGDSQRPERVELAAWTPADLAALLDSLQLGMPVDVAALAEHAGGDPFLTLETLKDMALGTAAAQPMPQPTTVAPLLERRLRSAPARAAPLLGLAAVFGADSTLDRAASALGCTLAEAAAQQEALEAAGLVRGSRLAHELLRQAALAAMPAGLRRLRHAQAAAALAVDPQVPPARVAAHWAAAGHWQQAGASFHAAGMAARDAGRLAEQEQLLDEAAKAWSQASDRGGEFDALAAAVEGVIARHGLEAVEARLPRLHALADTPLRQAQVALFEAELKVNRYYDAQTLSVAERAAALAEPHPALRSDAQLWLGLALAQAARFDEALLALDRAAAAATGERQARNVLGQRAYALYEAGRIGEAIVATAAALQAAQAADDRAVAGQLQGNLANLRMLSGDPAGAVEPARRARQQHREAGLGDNAMPAGMTLMTLGSALTACGQLGEAMAVLDESLQTLSAQAPEAMLAMARIASARLWLLLGEPARARAVLPESAPDWPPSILVGWHAMQAQAATLDGRPGELHGRRVREILAANATAPLTRTPWLYWARHGEPAEVAARMREVARQYRAAGMPGSACSALLHVVDALLEQGGAARLAEAAALATELQPHMAAGLHPTSYVPQAWLTLARAFEATGDRAAAAGCRSQGRQWIRQVALHQLPDAWRAGFLQRNPVNAELLRP